MPDDLSRNCRVNTHHGKQLQGAKISLFQKLGQKALVLLVGRKQITITHEVVPQFFTSCGQWSVCCKFSNNFCVKL